MFKLLLTALVGVDNSTYNYSPLKLAMNTSSSTKPSWWKRLGRRTKRASSQTPNAPPVGDHALGEEVRRQRERTADSSSNNPANEVDNLSSNVIDTSSESRSASTAKTFKDALVTALRLLQKSADAFPPLKSAVGGLVACIDLIEAVKGNHADYASLTVELTNISMEIEPYLSQLLAGDTTGSFARIIKSIQDEVDYVDQNLGRGTTRRVVEAQQDKDELLERYRKILNLFQRIQANIGLRTWEATMKVFQTLLLDRLLPVDDARFNSRYSTTVKRRGCTAETRKKILETLLAWARDANGAKVYWVNGLAGTGKTTILYTLCQLLVAEQQLGANYFCSRISLQCRDVNNIIPTLAYQLAQYSPAFRSGLCEVLEKEPEASKLDVASQVQKLIQEPLVLVKDALPEDIVIVIDALDECENASAMGIMLRALLQVAETIPVKFFITSRPEPAIQDKIRLSAYSGSTLHLHDIEESIINADIGIYLTEALHDMDPCPTPAEIQQLAERADKLFIFAATAVRYIVPDDTTVDSVERLHKVLEKTTSGGKQHEELDSLYLSIISAACDRTRLDDDEIHRTRTTFSAAVCAKEPMTTEGLASILGLTERQVRM